MADSIIGLYKFGKVWLPIDSCAVRYAPPEVSKIDQNPDKRPEHTCLTAPTASGSESLETPASGLQVCWRFCSSRKSHSKEDTCAFKLSSACFHRRR
jgi:hypothetical protein